MIRDHDRSRERVDVQLSLAQRARLRDAADRLASVGVCTPAMDSARKRNVRDESSWPPRLSLQLLVDVRAHADALPALGVIVESLPDLPAGAPGAGESAPGGGVRHSGRDEESAEQSVQDSDWPWGSGTRVAAPSSREPKAQQAVVSSLVASTVSWGSGTRVAAAPTVAESFAAMGVELAIPHIEDNRSAAAVLAEKGSGEPLLFDGLLDSLRGVPVDDLDGVGETTNEKMVAGGVSSVFDLLMRVPLRYVDRTQLAPLETLVAGTKQVTFVARVLGMKTDWEKRYVRFTLGDHRTNISAMFFHAMWMGQRFHRGDLLIVQGDLGEFNGALSMTSPLLELMSDSTAPLLAIYPQSQKHSVDTWMLRRAAVDALRRIPALDDPIPAPLLVRRKLPTRLAALRSVHVPESKADADLGRNRLAYDELLRLQLALGVLRNAQAAEPGVTHTPTGKLVDPWLAGLPYTPTGAQSRAIGQIRKDMVAARPMNRLLQGDVGAGKTLVLAATALMAIEGGYQAVLMAPTEILARQHFEEMAEVLRPLGVTVDLLVSRGLPRPRKNVLADLAGGHVNLLVGTHSVLSDPVVFANLGVALIDEQHRFGVDQRAVLATKGPGGSTPDILQATATPIPRTAAITTYGDVELSILDEKPPGRTPTVTTWLESATTDDPNSPVWKSIRSEISQGRQAFVVCPLVKVSGQDSETKMAAAAEDTCVALEAGALAGLRIGLATGKQKPDVRREMMRAFKEHELDVLVATTVIEVGVSVPNATVIAILDATKFGLAQLHQLRGRVGRGRWPGHCWLVGQTNSEDGVARMDAMCETDDGFVLADRDLQIRGPGSLTGSAQAGRDAGLLVADLIDDARIHLAARADAHDILARDPHLHRSQLMKREVEAALGDDAHYLTKS